MNVMVMYKCNDGHTDEQISEQTDRQTDRHIARCITAQKAKMLSLHLP